MIAQARGRSRYPVEFTRKSYLKLATIANKVVRPRLMGDYRKEGVKI